MLQLFSSPNVHCVLLSYLALLVEAEAIVSIFTQN